MRHSRPEFLQEHRDAFPWSVMGMPLTLDQQWRRTWMPVDRIHDSHAHGNQFAHTRTAHDTMGTCITSRMPCRRAAGSDRASGHGLNAWLQQCASQQRKLARRCGTAPGAGKTSFQPRAMFGTGKGAPDIHILIRGGNEGMRKGARVSVHGP